MYMYDYEEEYCEKECPQCTDKADLLNCAEYWVRCLVDIAYGKPRFENETFEDYLDELCGVFDIIIPRDKQLKLREIPCPLN